MAYIIGQLIYELSVVITCTQCYVMNSFEKKNDPFSVTKEKFHVVFSGEKRVAKYIIIRACIESTSYAA